MLKLLTNPSVRRLVDAVTANFSTNSALSNQTIDAITDWVERFGKTLGPMQTISAKTADADQLHEILKHLGADTPPDKLGVMLEMIQAYASDEQSLLEFVMSPEGKAMLRDTFFARANPAVAATLNACPECGTFFFPSL